MKTIFFILMSFLLFDRVAFANPPPHPPPFVWLTGVLGNEVGTPCSGTSGFALYQLPSDGGALIARLMISTNLAKTYLSGICDSMIQPVSVGGNYSNGVFLVRSIRDSGSPVPTTPDPNYCHQGLFQAPGCYVDGAG